MSQGLASGAMRGICAWFAGPTGLVGWLATISKTHGMMACSSSVGQKPQAPDAPLTDDSHVDVLACREMAVASVEIVYLAVANWQESQVISQLIDSFDVGSKGLEQLNQRCSPASEDENEFLLTDFNGLYIILGLLILLSIMVQFVNVKFLHKPIDPFDDDFGEGRKYSFGKKGKGPQDGISALSLSIQRTSARLPVFCRQPVVVAEVVAASPPARGLHHAGDLRGFHQGQGARPQCVNGPRTLPPAR